MIDQIWFIEESSKVFYTDDVSSLKQDFQKEFVRYLGREGEVIRNEGEIIIGSNMSATGVAKLA